MSTRGGPGSAASMRGAEHITTCVTPMPPSADSAAATARIRSSATTRICGSASGGGNPFFAKASARARKASRSSRVATPHSRRRSFGRPFSTSCNAATAPRPSGSRVSCVGANRTGASCGAPPDFVSAAAAVPSSVADRSETDAEISLNGETTAPAARGRRRSRSCRSSRTPATAGRPRTAGSGRWSRPRPAAGR